MLSLVHGGKIMGRITLSFRMQFQRQIKSLKEFCDALIAFEHKDEFGQLKKVWSSEMAAMIYVHGQIPGVLDLMLLMAVIDNRKEIMKLETAIHSINSKTNEI
jgi:hypothetical protein